MPLTARRLCQLGLVLHLLGLIGVGLAFGFPSDDLRLVVKSGVDLFDETSKGTRYTICLGTRRVTDADSLGRTGSISGTCPSGDVARPLMVRRPAVLLPGFALMLCGLIALIVAVGIRRPSGAVHGEGPPLEVRGTP